MYNCHYHYIKNEYGSKTRLLFTDTNNLIYNIETEIAFEDSYKDKELFDFSKFSKNSKYYDKTNNLIAGKMEDETCGVLTKSCCRINSKDVYLNNKRWTWM